MRRFTNHPLRPRDEKEEKRNEQKTNPTFKLTQSGEEGKSRQLSSRPPLLSAFLEDTTNDGNNQRSPGVATTQKITRFFIILLFSFSFLTGLGARFKRPPSSPKKKKQKQKKKREMVGGSPARFQIKKNNKRADLLLVSFLKLLRTCQPHPVLWPLDRPGCAYVCAPRLKNKIK